MFVVACNNHKATEKENIINLSFEDSCENIEVISTTTTSNSVDAGFLQSDSDKKLDHILDKMYSCSNSNRDSQETDTLSIEDCLYFFKQLDNIIESEYEPVSLCVYAFLFRNENSNSKFINAIAILSKNDSERDEFLCKVLDVIWLDCCISGGYDTKSFLSLSKDFPLFRDNKRVEDAFNHLVQERYSIGIN